MGEVRHACHRLVDSFTLWQPVVAGDDTIPNPEARHECYGWFCLTVDHINKVEPSCSFCECSSIFQNLISSSVSYTGHVIGSYRRCIFGWKIREIPRTQTLALSDPAILNDVILRPAILFAQIAGTSEQPWVSVLCIRSHCGRPYARRWSLWENSDEISGVDRKLGKGICRGIFERCLP